MTDKHSSNRVTSPVLSIVTVSGFISNTSQWFESNNGKNNPREVSIRRGSKPQETQFSDPQKVVLLTLHDLLLFKEFYRNGSVTQWQSPCLVCPEPQHCNNPANNKAVL